MMYRATQKKLKGLIGMARMLWKDRIGEEKIITGYNVDITIKFVDYVDGKIVVVESLNHNTYTVSKDVWKRGVFSEIIKDLCSTSPKEKKSKTTKAPRVSKYVGEEKMINDVLFRVEEYVKGKVKVIADGYEGYKEMAISTWKNAKFFKNIMKVLKRIVKYAQEKITEKYELVVYNDFTRDFLGRIQLDTMNRITKEFGECDTVADVRKLYKHYARYVHPDLGHNGIYDVAEFNCLTALRDTTIAFIEYWLEDDED